MKPLKLLANINKHLLHVCLTTVCDGHSESGFVVAERSLPHQHNLILHLHPGHRVLHDHPPPDHGLRLGHLQRLRGEADLQHGAEPGRGGGGAGGVYFS